MPDPGKGQLTEQQTMHFINKHGVHLPLREQFEAKDCGELWPSFLLLRPRTSLRYSHGAGVPGPAAAGQGGDNGTRESLS